MGLTDELQTKFSGFSINLDIGKNLKRVLQFNWDIDAVYCGLPVFLNWVFLFMLCEVTISSHG